MTEFDAVVVGSGMSGGWAAKELTEKGLKVLVVERGHDVRHGEDYKTEWKNPWEMPYRGVHRPPDFDERFGPLAGLYPTINEYNQHWFATESEAPYQTPKEKPFAWVRGYHLGGRSLCWSRQCHRLTDLDFTANLSDGYGSDWPIRYADIEPWYDYVEEFIGVSGRPEEIPEWPNGPNYLPPFEMNCAEQHFKEAVEAGISGRSVVMGRVANLTRPHKGRGQCQARSHCNRGCSFGAYFSSLSSTLPAAEVTGNLTVMTETAGEKLIVDPETGRVVEIQVVDAKSGQRRRISARLFVLCASAFNSVLTLLNSASERAPKGLGNSSGLLGRYVMDMPMATSAVAAYDGFQDRKEYGTRPSVIAVPRFTNLDGQDKPFSRGYFYQGGATRIGWSRGSAAPGIGRHFKEAASRPGPWIFAMTAFGDCLPRESNYIELDKIKVDPLGLPQLKIHFSFGENERLMMEDAETEAVRMLELAGARVLRSSHDPDIGGSAIHEMGGARMGRDPRTSVVNEWSQLHDAPNVLVTDGAQMVSSSCYGPSLTYMALTARSCDHAVNLMRSGVL